MITKPIIKDPAALRTYGIYWGELLAPGETITSVSWAIPAPLAKVSESVNAAPISEDTDTYPAGTVALVRLSGGTAGQNYNCICHITSTSGDEDERTLVVACRER